jgi:hypothetical protein
MSGKIIFFGGYFLLVVAFFSSSCTCGYTKEVHASDFLDKGGSNCKSSSGATLISNFLDLAAI